MSNFSSLQKPLGHFTPEPLVPTGLKWTKECAFLFSSLLLMAVKVTLSTVGLSALAKLLDFSGSNFCDLHYQILSAVLWIHTGISYPSLVRLDRVIE